MRLKNLKYKLKIKVLLITTTSLRSKDLSLIKLHLIKNLKRNSMLNPLTMMQTLLLSNKTTQVKNNWTTSSWEKDSTKINHLINKLTCIQNLISIKQQSMPKWALFKTLKSSKKYLSHSQYHLNPNSILTTICTRKKNRYKEKQYRLSHQML